MARAEAEHGDHRRMRELVKEDADEEHRRPQQGVMHASLRFVRGDGEEEDEDQELKSTSMDVPPMDPRWSMRRTV